MKKNIEHRPITIWDGEFEITREGDVYNNSTGEYLPKQSVILEWGQLIPDLRFGEYYGDGIGAMKVVTNPHTCNPKSTPSLWRVSDLVKKTFNND